MIRLVAIEVTPAVRSKPLSHGDRLGRLATCAFAIDHPSVSRVHARIERRDNDWFIVDEGSRNGVNARGERVGELRLEEGLELRLGDFAVRVEIVDTAPKARAPIAESFEFDLPAADEDGGLALEDPAEIDIGAAAAEPRSGRSQAAPSSAAASQPASSAVARQAAYLAEESRARSGLVRGDLTQQPGWLQGLVWLGVLLFAGGVAWLVVVLLG